MIEESFSPTPMARNDDWIIKVLEGLQETTPEFPDWSIHKVQRNLRLVNEDAYTPHIVSIGPIHYGDKRLLAMENHKRRYLLSLFNRTQEPEQILENCCHTIKRLDKKVRSRYAEEIPHDENKLAEILLHDAAFLLELFLRNHKPDPTILSQNDPIFRTSWMEYELRRDLALLENQIPFFVLKSVFKHLKLHAAAGLDLPPIKELALHFFETKINIREKDIRREGWGKGNHLLHLLYNCYLPPEPYPENTTEEWEIIHCATSLHQAGIQFKKNPKNDLFGFQFDNGTFKIPQLRTVDSTDSLFRNLVAFEQSGRDSKHYITSYIFLMDYLIDTTADVHLLQRKRIIENDLGCGIDVTDLFNNINKQIVLKGFYFAGLCDQVNAYAKYPWHRYKVALRRVYFKNPWSITSFVAAVILLLLTFLQTQYSVLSYYQESN